MKFCKNCGNQLEDTAAFCTKCGTAFELSQPQAAPQQPAYTAPPQPQAAPQQQAYAAPQQPYSQPQYGQMPYGQPYAPVQQPSGLSTAAKIFMIISTVVMGLYIIPLAWCLPMTISYFNKIKNRQPVSTGFKVCTLLFVNTIAGILMLCDKDN